MKFLIGRASNWFDNNKDKAPPCKNAYKELGEYPERKAWVVEISSLEDLIKLIKKEGDIIIGKSDVIEGFYVIKIYDDYVE
jgi:hypothetical protein